ncbi:MAG TPA: hypothetical protein VGL48_00870 [Acidimicrobiales bacterium]|jgi:hypothetical protein
MLAEHLVADRAYEVEVLTSCSVDALTWRDERPPGTGILNGVTVHRIASEAGRDEGFHPLSGALLLHPEQASDEDCQRWVDMQGPESPALLDAVAASGADVVAFYPYLYYPTVRGLLHATMRRNGLRDVEANYRWPVILDRYCSFLDEFVERQGYGVP